MPANRSIKASLAERAAAAGAAWAVRNRAVLIASGLFGALAHGFAFTNKLVNHDEVASLFLKGATVESGRWGLGLLDSILPNYSMPWIYGIMSIALLAVAVVLMCDVFAIRSRLGRVLLAGLVVTFPSLTGTFGYMFTSSAYAISFLLAVGAVWLLTRECPWLQIAALCAMIASLSIYQSYIAIAAALLVLVLLRQLLAGEKLQKLLVRGVLYVLFLAASLGLYYAATQVVLRITGVRMGQYASSSVTFRLADIPARIGLAYSMFMSFFTKSTCGLVPTAFSRLLHAFLAVLAAALAIIRIAEDRKDLPRILLGAALVAVLPLAVNCMYLITSPESIHTLVLYSFFAVYLVPLLLAEDSGPSALHTVAVNALPVVLAAVIAVNIYAANEAYLNLYLRYENAAAFYTALISDLRQCPEFTEGTKLAIVGNYQQPDFYLEKFEDIDRITGVHGFVPDNYSNRQFLTYYMGFSIPWATGEEILQIRKTPQFESMPCYPYFGSTALFDDVFVVKLS